MGQERRVRGSGGGEDHPLSHFPSVSLNGLQVNGVQRETWEVWGGDKVLPAVTPAVSEGTAVPSLHFIDEMK